MRDSLKEFLSRILGKQPGRASKVLEIAGRPLSPRRRRIAVLSPYFPFPPAHDGAVRIFYLLREMAEEFDIFLFAFRDRQTPEELATLADICARITVVDKPGYREPRWPALLPPEVHEFRSPAMLAALAHIRGEYKIDALQVEHALLAPYRGDILVEHAVRYGSYWRVQNYRGAALSRRWDCWRWRRFERRWAARYPRVVVTSERDRALLDRANVVLVPNGVDLERFTPEIERPGQRLLFIGSFRQLTDALAYRFFVEQVWPLLEESSKDIQVTVLAGSHSLLYWREHTGLASIPGSDRIQLVESVADVRPLYVEANLVLAPALVPPDANFPVLEAMAMERAVVTTFSGCAGLGLEHMANVWIADKPEDFALAIQTLLANQELRERIAAAGRAHVEQHYGWRKVGQSQRALLRDLLPPRVRIRKAEKNDLERIAAIQRTASEASQWLPRDYLAFDCQVAILDGEVAGFVVSRRVDAREREILNLVVHPNSRRLGVARELLRSEMARWPGTHFLEVRESNAAARRLYEQLGFQAVGKRPGYYENPPETGIVMSVFS